MISNAWKNILNLEFTKKRTYRISGNVSSIDFWYDDWINDSYLLAKLDLIR